MLRTEVYSRCDLKLRHYKTRKRRNEIIIIIIVTESIIISYIPYTQGKAIHWITVARRKVNHPLVSNNCSTNYERKARKTFFFGNNRKENSEI